MTKASRPSCVLELGAGGWDLESGHRRGQCGRLLDSEACLLREGV